MSNNSKDFGKELLSSDNYFNKLEADSESVSDINFLVVVIVFLIQLTTDWFYFIT